MKVTKRTEDEVANTIPPGFYKAEIEDASEQTDKSERDMLKLKLIVRHEEKMVVIFDYLSDHWMQHKTKHLIDQCPEIKEVVENGDGNVSAEDFIGRGVMVQLSIEHSEGYGARNKVVDYIGGVDGETSSDEEDGDEEELPFD